MFNCLNNVVSCWGVAFDIVIAKRIFSEIFFASIFGYHFKRNGLTADTAFKSV
jgi:hypothetical protein